MKVVIVGAGKLGLKVANTLLGGDHDVTIIDTNEDILQKISSQMDVMTINANAKEIKVLKRINIASYDFRSQLQVMMRKTSSSQPLPKVWAVRKRSPVSGIRNTCSRSVS